jgi:hypothetical protein
METIILDLDTHDMNSLVLEPAFQYENIWQRLTGVYKVVLGKSKYRMTHLSEPKNNLQPKTSCKNWNPTVSFGLRPDEVGTCEFELNGEQCLDEFDQGCFRNLREAADTVTKDPGATITAIEMAMAMQLRRGIGNDAYKIAWFGDPDFRADAASGVYDLSAMPAAEKEKMIAMMEHCSGWFNEIVARTSETAEYGKVRLVNSNDGTASGNALNPSNITGFLQDMINNSHPILRFWNRQRPQSEWPMFLLSPDLFSALIEYYRSVGQVDQRMFIMNGTPVPGMTTFDGYPVMEVPEWLMFDYETGGMLTSGAYIGKTKKQRALFTAKENLVALAHARTLEGDFAGSSFVIQKSPILKDKGARYMYGAWGMGFGIAQPVLMTLGLNSSTSYVNA